MVKPRLVQFHMPSTKDAKVLMYADLNFDGLEVRSWRLAKNQDGNFFIGYPSSKSNEYRQVIPRTPELQAAIKDVMVNTYLSVKKGVECRD